MRLLGAYLLRQKKLLLLLIGSLAIFAAVFSLYDLPLEPIFYAAVLCLVLGAALFAVSFALFLHRHRELERLLPLVTCKETRKT